MVRLSTWSEASVADKKEGKNPSLSHPGIYKIEIDYDFQNLISENDV